MSVDAIQGLFGGGLADLGPARRAGVWSADEVVDAVAVVCGAVRFPGRAAVCLEGLVLLWHDHLEAAHARVQDLPGADAAFVHGIMHRREPDYGNARYWFHRVGDHPAYDLLADAAAPVLAARPALPHRLIRDGRWDAFAFVDAVAAVAGHERESESEVLRGLQRLESVVLARHLAGMPRDPR